MVSSLAHRQGVGLALLLAGLVLAAYWPALQGAFIWDDHVLITTNPLVHAGDGLWRIWFTTQAVDYWPVTNSSFWIEWRLWGPSPVGYHVTNALLHAASAWCLWNLLRRLHVPGASLAALLFAVHPLNVESVAWITQRKNTLSLLLVLASVFAYVRCTERVAAAPPPAGRRRRTAAVTSSPASRQRSWYVASLGLFTLAMLSKGSVATLPAMLLAITWWQRRTLTAPDLRLAAPFFAVAVTLTGVNVWFQARGAGGLIRDVSLIERLLGAAGTVWFYLSKSLAPTNLMFIYPQWVVRTGDWRWWLPVSGLVAVSAILLWQRTHPRARHALALCGLFGLALLPVMGLTDVYYMKFSLVSDHYAYLATVVCCAGVGSVLGVAATQDDGRYQRVMMVAAALLIAVLAATTFWNSRVYASERMLYRATIEANPQAWVAHNNLALLYLKGSADERALALGHLRAAAALRPDDASVRNNLGTAQFQAGDLQAAAAEHAEAVRLDADHLEARANLAADLAGLGRSAEAVTALTEVLRRDPTRTYARADLARALESLGRTGEAAEQWRMAASGTGASALDRAAAGDALLRMGRAAEAVAQYEAALRLDPQSTTLLNNLSYGLIAAGRLGDAERHLRTLLRVKPSDAAAHANLGNALQQSGRLEEALAEFALALQHGSGPDLAHIHNDAGIVYAKLGRRRQAIEHFREALRLNPSYNAARNNLTRAEGS